MNLQLALKFEYFDAIKAGTKLEEYRLDNQFWQKRLIIGGSKGVLARTFDGIILTKGYPKRGDPERTIELPWRGWKRKTITHPHFGPSPVSVFAIDVSLPTRKASDMSENIPAGWKLVPIDATKAMEEAAVSRVRPYHDTDWSQHMPKDLFRLAWPALLDAAPQPPLSKPGGTSVANFEAHLTRILEEYEQRREAIQEDEEVKDRFIILRAFELAVAAREDQP